MSKQIAFFDFDGTITTRDTLLEFIKFSKGGLAFYAGFLINAPYILAYKLGGISNQAAKEKILRFFFKGMNQTIFENLAKEFAVKRIPEFVRPTALHLIQAMLDRGITVVVVTASPENWVGPWTKQLGLDLIGTRLQVIDQRITGNIVELNCYGEEKVKRIRRKYQLEEYDEITAYGDTPGDLPMLKLAHKSFYKPFRN